MLDNDDADGMFLVAMVTNGPIGLVFLVIFLIIVAVVSSNEDECTERTCEDDKISVLMENRCLCVEEASR